MFTYLGNQETLPGSNLNMEGERKGPQWGSIPFWQKGNASAAQERGWPARQHTVLPKEAREGEKGKRSRNSFSHGLL